jgi:sugar phosphate isomerase/epimerase
VLRPGNLALAAMTLHVDLVETQGCIPEDVDRTIQCVEKTAALAGRFGDNERPVLVWHPSGYPEGEGIDDDLVFQGLCEGLGTVCKAAEQQNLAIAVEITRAGSVGSAEMFLRIRDQVKSDALGVCIDAANFAPDRTPLERAVRMLRSDIVIAHAKDSSFTDNGEVADYGPVGTGRLDYPTYIRSLQAYCNVPYLVFEYYRSREQLLTARDIVNSCLTTGAG